MNHLRRGGHGNRRRRRNFSTPGGSVFVPSITGIFKDGAEGFNQGPFTSNRVVLTPNTLVTYAGIGFSNVSAGPVGTPNTLSFSEVYSVADSNRGLRLYTTIVPPGGFTGTITAFTSSDFMLLYEIYEWDGADTIGVNGIRSVLQAGIHLFFVPPNDPVYDPLPYPTAFTDAANAGYGFFNDLPGGNQHGPYTPRVGWTFSEGSFNSLSLLRDNEDPASACGYTASVTGSTDYGVYVEIKAKGAPGWKEFDNNSNAGTGAATYTVVANQAVQVGDTIIIWVSYNNAGSSSIEAVVTDNLGNTYQRPTNGIQKEFINNRSLEGWYSIVTHAGTPTVQVQFNPIPGTTTVTQFAVNYEAYSGSDSASTVDGSASQTQQVDPGGTDEITSGNFVTTKAQNLIVAGFIDTISGDSWVSPGTGFAPSSKTTNGTPSNIIRGEYRVQRAAGTISGYSTGGGDPKESIAFAITHAVNP